MSDLPGCLLEWEKNLRRCLQEGRTPPDEPTKRLALLRMLPAKQRESIWPVANQLYPTFSSLLSKIQEMVQDEMDSKNGGSPMDLDRVEEEGEWEDTNRTLVGKGPQGEEILYMLQRRGSSTRVRPKGAGRKGAPR